MNETETLFLQISDTFLSGRNLKTDNESGEDSDLVIGLAKKHSMQAICEYVLFGQNSFVNQTFARSVKRIFAANELIAEFEKRGIKLCVMKGFIIRDFYPVPELRTFGDIDFLIEKGSVADVVSVMSELGYNREAGEEHVMSFKKGLEYYEFHTSLAEDDAFDENVQKLIDGAWDYAKPYGGYENIYEFEDEYHLFYLIFHIAKHFRVSGAGVRMFCDIAAFVKEKISLDYEKLSGYLKSCDMLLFAKNVFAICEKWFGVKSPIDAGYSMPDELYNEITEFVLNGGTFGFCGSSLEASEIRREMDKNDSGNAEKRTLLRFFFPTYEKMKKRYPFIAGKKFLLPIAYIMRFFGNIFRPRRAKKAVSRLQGIRSGGEDASRQHKMYRECGLDFFK